MEQEILTALRARRLELQVSQRHVAEAMGGGVTQSMVSEWETGAVDIKLTTLVRWVKALEVTIHIHIED